MNTFKFFAQDPLSIFIEHNQCPDCNHQLIAFSGKDGIFFHTCDNCHSSFIESPLGFIRNTSSETKHFPPLETIEGF